MARLILIDTITAVVLAVIWYLYFASYNRRRGLQALVWVEAACSGQGGILQVKWLTPSCLEAKLRFSSHWFENAKVTIQLFPRTNPFHWLYSLLRKEEEILTFAADLDDIPGFHLEVVRHRWFTREHATMDEDSQDWSVFRPGPVVFSTRPQWNEELPPVVHTFMTSRGHSLVSVNYRPQSPHITATVPLSALCDQESAAGFMRVLRDLAAGAGTLQQ